MQRTFLWVTIIFTALIADNHALAADMANRYLISGIGKDSCRAYIQADDTGKAYYLTWLSGYITAHNYYEKDTYSIVGSKSIGDIEKWLREYCFANLSHTFDDATKRLIRSLTYFRQKNYYDN